MIVDNMSNYKKKTETISIKKINIKYSIIVVLEY